MPDQPDPTTAAVTPDTSSWPEPVLGFLEKLYLIRQAIADPEGSDDEVDALILGAGGDLERIYQIPEDQIPQEAISDISMGGGSLFQMCTSIGRGQNIVKAMCLMMGKDAPEEPEGPAPGEKKGILLPR